jgi:hypothetical protein
LKLGYNLPLTRPPPTTYRPIPGPLDKLGFNPYTQAKRLGWQPVVAEPKPGTYIDPIYQAEKLGYETVGRKIPTVPTVDWKYTFPGPASPTDLEPVPPAEQARKLGYQIIPPTYAPAPPMPEGIVWNSPREQAKRLGYITKPDAPPAPPPPAPVPDNFTLPEAPVDPQRLREPEETDGPLPPQHPFGVSGPTSDGPRWNEKYRVNDYRGVSDKYGVGDNLRLDPEYAAEHNRSEESNEDNSTIEGNTSEGSSNGSCVEGAITATFIVKQRQEAIRQLCRWHELLRATLQVAARQDVTRNG